MTRVCDERAREVIAVEPRAKLKVGLVAAGLGVACLLGGLALDVALHARDPGLAAREGVFATGNPGHVLAGAGIVLTVLGIGTSALAVFTPRRRYLSLAVLGAVVLGAGAVGVAAPSLGGHEHADTAAAQADPIQDDEATGHMHDSVDRSTLGAEAWELLAEVRASVARFEDEDAAVEAGYRPPRDPKARAAHYINPTYMWDDEILDPRRPEGLVYFTDQDGTQTLVGAVFKSPLGVDPPNPGGVRWHTHMPGCERHDD
ncbi:MAG: hypothetical protein ACRDKJ_07230, partial [Actinomycetota bacterium]